MQQVPWVRAQEERQVSRHSLLASLLFPTSVHSLLECLHFNWYILIVVSMLCPFHNMECARTLLVVAMNTQALCTWSYACAMMESEWMPSASVSRHFKFVMCVNNHNQYFSVTQSKHWLCPLFCHSNCEGLRQNVVLLRPCQFSTMSTQAWCPKNVVHAGQTFCWACVCSRLCCARLGSPSCLNLHASEYPGFSLP